MNDSQKLEAFNKIVARRNDYAETRQARERLFKKLYWTNKEVKKAFDAANLGYKTK